MEKPKDKVLQITQTGMFGSLLGHSNKDRNDHVTKIHRRFEKNVNVAGAGSPT